MSNFYIADMSDFYIAIYPYLSVLTIEEASLAFSIWYSPAFKYFVLYHSKLFKVSVHFLNRKRMKEFKFCFGEVVFFFFFLEF